MTSKFQSIFLRGLFTFLPIALTIYIIYVVVSLIDRIFGDVIRSVFPESVQIPGLGFLITVILIFFFGLLLNNFLAQSILSNLERKLLQVPFLKAVYAPLRDLMNLFSQQNGGSMKSVVFFQLAEGGPQFMGLVTREVFDDIPALKDHVDQRVAVYLPMSYGFGGFTILVPRSMIKSVDIPIERAMSLAITAWVKSSDRRERD